MLDGIHEIIAGSVLLTVIAIAYGGYFLTTVVRGSVPANALQKTFFRAGHAHAGVLVTLGLLTLLITQVAGVPAVFGWTSLGVLVSAIFIPAGFFLSVLGKNPERPNRAIVLIWIGAAALTVGLLGGGIGLIVSGSGALA